MKEKVMIVSTIVIIETVIMIAQKITQAVETVKVII